MSNCMILIRIFLGGSDPWPAPGPSDLRLKRVQCGQCTCLHGPRSSSSLHDAAAVAAASATAAQRRQFSKNRSFCRKKKLPEIGREAATAAEGAQLLPLPLLAAQLWNRRRSVIEFDLYSGEWGLIQQRHKQTRTTRVRHGLAVLLLLRLFETELSTCKSCPGPRPSSPTPGRK